MKSTQTVTQLTLDQMFGLDPSHFTPHVYQEAAIQMALGQPAHGLIWDMGLGKSATELSILERDRTRRLPCLIVAPLRCVYNVWPQEIEDWGFDFDTSIIHGGPAAREAALKKRADIYLINPEGIAWLHQYLKAHRRVPFKSIIIDESTKFKNPKAKRFKALAEFIPHIKYRSILTGTPLPKGYADLWSQIYALDLGASLGKRFGIYEMEFFTSDGWGTLELVPGAKRTIDDRVSHLVSRGDADDLLQMPELRENLLRIEQPKKSLDRMYEILSGFAERRSAAADFGEDSAEDAEATTQDRFTEEVEIKNLYAALRTVCSGFQYFPIMSVDPKTGEEKKIGVDVERIHEHKLDVAEELIEGIGGKNLLIAFNFTEERKMLVEKFGCPYIDGKVSASKASQHIEAWKRGELPLLAVHPMSVGHGINLQSGGHHMLWYSLPDSLEAYQQTNARLYRQGQKNSVTLHSIISRDTVEEKIAGLLRMREFDQKQFLDALKRTLTDAAAGVAMNPQAA